MDKYIGIDVHARSCTLAVVDGVGKRVGRTWSRRTGEPGRVLRDDPGRAARVPRGGDAERVAVRDPVAARRRRWSWRRSPRAAGQKSDERDAFALAEELRTGALKKRVFKEAGEYRTLRELGANAHRWSCGRGAGAEPDQGLVPIARRRRRRQERVLGEGPRGVHGEAARRERARRRRRCSRSTTRSRRFGSSAEKELVAEAHRHATSRAARDLSRARPDSRGAVDADRGLAGAVPDQAAVLVVLRSRDRDAVVVGLGSRRQTGGWQRAKVQTDARPESEPQPALKTSSRAPRRR